MTQLYVTNPFDDSPVGEVKQRLNHPQLLQTSRAIAPISATERCASSLIQ